MSFPVALVEVRVISHATENIEKVLESLKNVLTSEVYSGVNFSEEKLEGHHGNPIVLVKTKVYSKSYARKIIYNVFSRLEDFDRNLLLKRLEDNIDEDGNFYLRLDKQAAYNGVFKVSSSDPIHLKIKLTVPRRQREKISEFFRKMIVGDKL
ncbi:MAG: RNA-binding domain-containing protein [Candidatus Bathyarchaeota archaeon]